MAQARKDLIDQSGFLPSSWRRDWLLGFFLVTVAIIAYQPAWHAAFIWDDDKYVTEPELRSLHGLARIWTQPGVARHQYYPLVYSIFWVEHKLWGDAAAGYHWVNILLHAFSALLLVKILRQLKIPGAWLAAALFALHPVEVESVAWISELKNTLSGVFYLSSALAYLEFDRNRRGGKYALALGLFLLGLMSKSVIASLPGALLVVFWWQRGKLAWKRDVLPLVPFFMAGIGAGLLTAWVERKFIGAEGSGFHFSIIERCLIAGRAIWFYLGKLVWPVDLAFTYPRWQVSQTVWWQYLFPAAALLLLGLLIWRRWRGPLAGLLFFVGTLFPALGFVNVYPFRYSFVADHFQYLASLGPLTLAAVGITAGAGFFWKKKPVLEWMLCASLLLVLATLTWMQSGMYADADTLWLKTIQVNPDCWLAENNLGSDLLQNGRADEAIGHFQKALQSKPDYAPAHNNLGTVLFQMGRTDEAIVHLQKAVQLEPDNVETIVNLGLALMQTGNMDEAMALFQKALQIKPNSAVAHHSLAMALFQKGKLDEAIAHYQKALEIHPDYADAHVNLGIALLQKGSPNEAIPQFQKALQLQPNDAELHYYLGNALLQKQDLTEAIAEYQKSLLIKPDPVILHTLAAAFAAAGQFAEAQRAAQKAIELARAAGRQDLVEQLNGELKRYEAGRPLHE